MRSCPTTRTRILRAVALLARSFNIVVVNPASPIKSIADLIAAAKAAARQAHLWHLRHRHFGTSGRRIVQAHGRGQSGDGALQRRGARDHRPDGRPDRRDLHDGGQRRVAGRSRPVARHRRDVGGTLAGVPAASHGVGSRRSRLRRRSLVRPLRAGQDAAGDHRPSQQVGGESRSVRGIQEAWCE